MTGLRKLGLFSVLIAAIAVFGCGTDGDGNGGGGAGNGGDAGNGGGTAGNGGTGGVGGGGDVVTQGLYSTQRVGTLVCLFVNEERTKLVEDANCYSNAFRFVSNPGVEPSCAITYPVEGDTQQEATIENGQFLIESTRTDFGGTYDITVSGTFADDGTVSGVASHSRDCPVPRDWSASAGCCFTCAREGWCQ